MPTDSSKQLYNLLSALHRDALADAEQALGDDPELWEQAILMHWSTISSPNQTAETLIGRQGMPDTLVAHVCASQDAAWLQMLLRNGLDLQRPVTHSGGTPLHCALGTQDPDTADASVQASIVEALLAAGAPADQPDAFGVTPRMLATSSGSDVLADLFAAADRKPASRLTHR